MARIIDGPSVPGSPFVYRLYLNQQEISYVWGYLNAVLPPAGCPDPPTFINHPFILLPTVLGRSMLQI